jgi:predicted methyltransferase
VLPPATADSISARNFGSGVGVCAADDGGSPMVEVIYGDCRDVMPLLPAGVFDACICDPPYGLHMADWDQDVPAVEVWREVRRLLKPGAVRWPSRLVGYTTSWAAACGRRDSW